MELPPVLRIVYSVSDATVTTTILLWHCRAEVLLLQHALSWYYYWMTIVPLHGNCIDSTIITATTTVR
eukprot:3119855-Pyramimonas_sp.AAC.1